MMVYIINSINVELFNSKLQSEKEDENFFYYFFISAKNQFEQRRDVLSLCMSYFKEKSKHGNVSNKRKILHVVFSDI